MFFCGRRFESFKAEQIFFYGFSVRLPVSNTLCISHVLCTYSASSCQIMQVVNLCFYDESPRYPVVSCTHNCAKYNDVRRSVPSSSLLFICECVAKCQNNNIIRKYIFLCIFFFVRFCSAPFACLNRVDAF